MITTDIGIIGAGPTGMFAVFEAGLLKMHCHLIDSLPQAGGQLSKYIPKNPSMISPVTRPLTRRNWLINYPNK
jgi:thioredoxin reductase